MDYFAINYLSGLVTGLAMGWIANQLFTDYKGRLITNKFDSVIDSTDKFDLVSTEDFINDPELVKMFNDEDSRKSRTVEEIRDVGRKMGPEPVYLPTSRSGGYVTNRDLIARSQKNKEFKKKVISRADEIDIIRTFQFIVGMNFLQAQKILKEQGYYLHPVYINNGCKRVSPIYSGTILGVKISDPDDSVSGKSVITEIIDVGGQDKYNRGVVKI